MRLTHNLLDTKESIDRALHSSFRNDPFVRAATETDFQYVLNQTSKAPEHLAAFADYVLRKGIKGRNEDETKQLLDKVATLFRSLHEKELFERYYKQ